MTRSRTAARLLALLALLMLCQLGLTGPASAHTSLVSTVPAAGAVSGPAPQQVALTFSKAVSPVLAEVVVTGPDGQQWQAGAPSTSGADVTQPLQPLTVPGEYQVAWRVVAADGHPISGTYAFQFAAPVPVQPAADAPVQPAGDASTGSAAPPQTPPAADAAAGPPIVTTLATSAPPAQTTWLSVFAGLLAGSMALALMSLLLRRRTTARTQA
ncbi:MAG: copper resistance protein CopC [Nocardioides sp.]|nr:copper resistance protein CopC [Nocardioides sp.]